MLNSEEVVVEIRKWSLECACCGHLMSAKTAKALDEAIDDHRQFWRHEPLKRRVAISLADDVTRP